VEASFGRVIKEHLELQRRNRPLETTMPLDRYVDRRVVDGHALFKPERTARHEEASKRDDWPTRDEPLFPESPEELWSAPPAFDWGD
jgi:hypothetical protein